jgi:prolyl-tRNA synthetase
MRLSRGFIPTLKETPAEAQIASHRLMLRAGLVRQTSAGIYAWLPLGLRVLRITDRHDRDMLYGPTNEEMVTDLFRQSIRSYRELPQILYHIQWKFRDEVRPRFGVMRGREFLMKDAYSFDIDHAGAVTSYRKMMLAYMRTFQRMGLKAIPMEADTGPIGGDLSHEFIILAPTGESQVFFDAAFEEMDYLAGDYGHTPDDLARFFGQMTTHYAATEEKHDLTRWDQLPADRRREGRGIEVGHIFYFGTNYTKAMNATVAGADGKPVFPEMGSYGVGVSRLVGAVIEASHDEAGIIWPDAIAPFKAAILNLKIGDAACDAMCEKLYAALGDQALYDDRTDRAGAKFADADLMGHPWQIVVGPRGAAAGTVELKRRATREKAELSVEAALARIG